jgi:1-deoxy-D-xylulose 5-phosphate reductoisomerase
MIPLINFLNNNSLNYLPIIKKFNFNNEFSLNFSEVNNEIYPIYNYFKSIDKSNPRNLIKFNLGNEYAVDLFKQKKIKYIEILQLIKEITSLNVDSDVNNIHNIIQYHEDLKLHINSNFF